MQACQRGKHEYVLLIANPQSILQSDDALYLRLNVSIHCVLQFESPTSSASVFERADPCAASCTYSGGERVRFVVVAIQTSETHLCFLIFFLLFLFTLSM